jgi:Uma2 family endonuclease
VRPDLASWRRDRVKERPQPLPGARATRERPDWVCEILSLSNAHYDLGKKLGLYHRNHIAHYWVLSPEHRTLSVYRFTAEGYLLVAAAGPDEPARLEPFDASPLRTGELFAP